MEMITFVFKMMTFVYLKGGASARDLWLQKDLGVVAASG